MENIINEKLNELGFDLEVEELKLNQYTVLDIIKIDKPSNPLGLIFDNIECVISYFTDGINARLDLKFKYQFTDRGSNGHDISYYYDNENWQLLK